MKLDIEALAREAGPLLRSPPDWWIDAFARLIVERCAAECESRLAGDAKLVGEHLANRLRQLMEDK